MSDSDMAESDVRDSETDAILYEPLHSTTHSRNHSEHSARSEVLSQNSVLSNYESLDRTGAEEPEQGGFFFLGSRPHPFFRNSFLNQDLRESGFLEAMLRIVGATEDTLEFDETLRKLAQRDDTYELLQTLNELSEWLLMTNAITAERTIDPDKLAAALMAIFSDAALANELEIHLVACRCLYNFMEVNLDYILDALNHGAVNVLVKMVLEIVYIDLTEQALQALEMMTREPRAHPVIVAANGLKGCLQNIDFLTIHAQRKCLVVIANSCTAVSPVHFDKIVEVFDSLTSVAESHPDLVVVENAWLAISRVANSFQTQPRLLLQLFSKAEMFTHLLYVIKGSCNALKPVISHAACMLLLKSLVALAGRLVPITCMLLEIDVGGFVRGSLANYDDLKGSLSIEAFIAAPNDLLLQFLLLIGHLLPRPYPYAESPFTLVESETAPDEKAEVLRRLPQQYWLFINEVMPILVLSFQTTMDYEMRKKVLISLYRILAFCEGEDYKTIENLYSVTSVLLATISGAKKIFSTKHSQDKRRSIVQQALLSAQALRIIRLMVTTTQGSCLDRFAKEGLFDDAASLLTTVEGLDSADEIPLPSSIGRNRALLITDVELEQSFEDYFTVARAFQKISEAGSTLVALRGTGDAASNQWLGDVAQKLAKLNAYLGSYENWVNAWSAFRNVVATESSETLSYELISLGVIAQVVKILESNSLHELNLRRGFEDVFFDGSDSLKRFVELLQELFTRLESFMVVTSGNFYNRSLSAYTSALAGQVRLKLVADEGSHALLPPKMHTMDVTVHVIATLKSVDLFIMQKLAEVHKCEDLMAQFSIDGEIIPLGTTVYGAIYRALEAKDTKVEGQTIWNQVHVVSYKMVKSEQEAAMPIVVNDEDAWDATTGMILNLLRIIFNMNAKMAHRQLRLTLDADLFTNWKITVKLNRQLEEPLVVASGTLPGWSVQMTKKYPFMFPLSTRMLFLQSTSFGYSRLIHNWQTRTQDEASDGSLQLGRALRQKVRISRDHILESALKLLDLYGLSPGLLEIEYFDEVGTGLGPTLEFYSTISREFARTELCLWRDENQETFVSNPKGLFPAPMSHATAHTENGQKILRLFAALGKFVARALIDSRIVDFRFSPMFFETVRSLQRKTDKVRLNLDCLAMVDPLLAHSLALLLEYAPKKSGLRVRRRSKSDEALHELSLTYTLPGYPDYELAKNGAETEVAAHNVRDYVDDVIDATMGTGVERQVRAFIAGFSEVFPISSLDIFSLVELVDIFGSSDEDWLPATLTEAIKANHGYLQDSVSVKRLVSVLHGLTTEQRRQFLQFLTGSPKLPIGGFKLIRPDFTVVKKIAESGLKSDDYLPSVMTCANYLKLPDYSLEAVMKRRLLHAISEGAGSFHLS